MNDLIKSLSQKFHLSEEQSSQAVKIVLNFLKDKLPDPASSQLDKLIMSLDVKETPGNAINDLGSKFTTK
ncbi:MAG TPA: hypothetical protein VLB50_06340 [Ignavibacteriaceae bacterium]|nr:hypothetical protein [Ignavibacteriaceae bacterium]